MEKVRLASILRKAYSGELAAALAYAGHWRSLPPGDDRSAIRRIEQEELLHRRELGNMLEEIGEPPSALRETWFRIVGKTIAYLCHIGGWFIPMYGAGRLEAGNVREYEDAARLARTAGYERFVIPLVRMSVVEAEHERYFREKTSSHWLSRIVPLWPAPRESSDWLNDTSRPVTILE
ncbi:MAG TPA: ferritin-like domain-containing protein [Vicinamibacteria bacterium]|nr:ferritin-like domain-containing protein [Vicinamibacteria bacterium]